MENLITFNKPKSRSAEAFRTLRTNIQFSDVDDNLKTIIITSTCPGEGKSTVLANLAVAFAQSGRKVLIVDCDLRRPTVHKNFKVSNSHGLTNILIKEKTIEECVNAIDIDGLNVITCGPIPPNPSELLGSKKMGEFIQAVEGEFDIVLLDAPPVLAVTDAQILSKVSDGVLLLSSYGTTEKKALIKAKEYLDKVGANVLGVILNKVKSEGGSYSSKYYEYYESND